MKNSSTATQRLVFSLILVATFCFGTGTALAAAPEIVVEQPEGTDLVDGAATVAFGNQSLDVGIERTFFVFNSGDANLTGVTATIDGADASDFEISYAPAPVVGPLNNTSFNVRFTPSATGARTAALHITSNDANENPFDITLTGTGVLAPGPEIRVDYPDGTSLAKRARINFGIGPVGTGSPVLFTIKNRGDAPLTGVAATIDGPGSADYVISTPPAGTVPSGGSTTLAVVFTPSAVANRRADLHIASNDANENPFDLRLEGSGVAAGSAAAWLKYELPPAGGSHDPAGAAVTAAGDFIVAYNDFNGITSQSGLRLVSYSGANGQVITSQFYVGLFARDLKLAPDGDFVVGGFEWTFSPDIRWLAVTKFSAATLGVVWRYHRSGTDTGSMFSDADEAKSVAVDAAGNVYAAGVSDDADGNHAIAMKLSGATGGDMSLPHLEAVGSGYSSVAVAASGAVFIAGRSVDYSSYPYVSRITMSRFNESLFFKDWQTETVTSNGYYYKVVVGPNGDPVACGYVANETTGSDRLLVRKWNGATGNAGWEMIREVGQTVEYHSEGFDVTVDGNGDIAVTGYSWRLETLDEPDHPDFYTAKLAGVSGALIWEQLYNPPSPGGAGSKDFAWQVVIEPGSNNVIVCGDSDLNSTNTASRGVSLRRYASFDGAVLNESFQPLPDNPTARYLRMDAAGALFVAAGFEDSDENGIGAPMKFSSMASGAPLQTLGARNITATSARLNGVLTPGAAAFNMVFEWSENPIPAPRIDLINPFNHTETASPPVIFAFNPATPFHLDLGGLQPHTTYHFRARANFLPSAALWGEDLIFTTLNRKPVAAPDAVTVSYESWITVLPLANDSEPDNDPITMTGFEQPWYGSVVRTGNSFLYTAAPGFKGMDQFTYTIEDGFGGVSEGTVTVIVQETYNAWLSTHNLTGLDAAADADPNHDGIKNIQAFLHGITPSDTPTFEEIGRLPVPGMITPVSGPPCFTYTYYKSASAGVNIVYEASETLQGAWTTITPTNTTILWSDPFTGDRIIRVEFCLTNGETRQFVRMVLTAP